MDTDKLLQALDNESNEDILNFTTKKIQDLNKQILNELSISKETKMDMMNKLKGYKYVDEVDTLKYGSYIRWIYISDVNDEDIKLTKGAIFCETKITDDGIALVCKNYGFQSRHFQIDLDDNLIFQKITSQEQVILYAMDHLSK